MSKEVAKKEELSITKTFNLTKPEEVVEMANILKTYIVKQNLYANIKGKNYAMVEGWQFAGFLSGLNVMVEEPKDLSHGEGKDREVKWSCTAKLYLGENVAGVGYALCSNLEVNKKAFDEYAILSMCQTRAIGKAYRNKIGWIMKLAGYESTPKEEMDSVHKPESEEPKVVKDFMEDLQPSDEDLIKYQEKLESARDKKELRDYWASTPVMIRAKLQSVYEKIKSELK